jgi:hypothetical protein
MEFPITALHGLMTPTGTELRWEALIKYWKALPHGKAFFVEDGNQVD